MFSEIQVHCHLTKMQTKITGSSAILLYCIKVNAITKKTLINRKMQLCIIFVEGHIINAETFETSHLNLKN